VTQALCDKGMYDAVGELSTRTDQFGIRGGPTTCAPTAVASTLPAPRRRRPDPAYDSLDLRAEPGRTMTVDAAEPNSSTAHALRLLASWAATMRVPSGT
jgi:hypothetical protein